MSANRAQRCAGFSMDRPPRPSTPKTGAPGTPDRKGKYLCVLCQYNGGPTFLQSHSERGDQPPWANQKSTPPASPTAGLLGRLGWSTRIRLGSYAKTSPGRQVRVRDFRVFESRVLALGRGPLKLAGVSLRSAGCTLLRS